MMTVKLGLLALVAVTATGQDFDTRFNRFQLFNNCEPIKLTIEDLDDDAADIGLTKERLVLAVESRLRGARLYTEDGIQPFLNLMVNVVGEAFSISLDYNKPVRDFASGEVFYAPTWHAGGAGTHGAAGAEFIVSGVSRNLDQFLTEYLRVNEAACSSR